MHPYYQGFPDLLIPNSLAETLAAFNSMAWINSAPGQILRQSLQHAILYDDSIVDFHQDAFAPIPKVVLPSP
jgi:hypothetical protein